MQLFNSMSSPSFLLANETNHALLRSLLEAINSIVEHQYSSELAYLLTKSLILTKSRKSPIHLFHSQKQKEI